MRARSASISASGISTANGRTAVAAAELSVLSDMGSPWCGLVVGAELAVLDRARALRGRRVEDQLMRIPSQVVQAHDRSPGGCIAPVTPWPVTLVCARAQTELRHARPSGSPRRADRRRS